MFQLRLLHVSRLANVAAPTVVAILMAPPSPVHACTCAPNAIWESTPGDGDTDVPIDIAPVIQGYFEGKTVSLASEAGINVVFELTVGGATGACTGRNGELKLEAPLEPNMRYLLRAVSEIPNGETAEISFTTGSTRVPEVELAAPALRATFLKGSKLYDGCSSEVQGCIGVDDEDTQIELAFRMSSGVTGIRLVGEDTQVTFDSVPECVEARTRDAAGRRSAATILCGKELNPREATDEDFRDFALACDDGVIHPSEPPKDAGAQTSDAGLEVVSSPSDQAKNGDEASSMEEDAPASSSSTCAVKPSSDSDSLLALLSTLALAFATRGKRRRS